MNKNDKAKGLADFNKFKLLMSELSRDCMSLSSGSAVRRHPNFQKLMEFENRISFACLLLGCNEEGTFCHESLAILYESVPEADMPPIPHYYDGRIPVIVECWRFWALHTGLLEVKYDPNSYWVEDKYGNIGDWH